MKSYELVKDRKSGLSRVLVREERAPSDPFANESIRRFGVEKRARIASVKALWTALRFSWRDRAQRMRVLGHFLFFVALVSAPVMVIGFYVARLLFHEAASLVSPSRPESHFAFILVAALVAILVLRSAARKLFRR